MQNMTGLDPFVVKEIIGQLVKFKLFCELEEVKMSIS